MFVFVFVFMFAAGPVCGQYTAGVKAGVNVSDVYFAYGALKEDIRFGMGLNVGLFVNRRLHDRWDLQVEAAYSQQGYRCVRPVRSSGSTEVLNGYRFFTHYLNLPVMLMFYPLERVYVEGGIQVGFRLGHKYYAGGGEWDNLDRERERTDYSFVGGVGILLGKGFSVNARYGYGLPANASPQGTDYGNRVFQLSIAYDL